MTALSSLRFISGLAAGVIAEEAAADIQTRGEQPGRQHNGHGYQAPRKAPGLGRLRRCTHQTRFLPSVEPKCVDGQCVPQRDDSAGARRGDVPASVPSGVKRRHDGGAACTT